MRDAPPGAEELAISKASFVDTFPRSFESATQIARTFANDEVIGRPRDYWAKFRGRISAVTAADVQRATRKYLDPERFVVLVVGKWTEIAPGDPQGRASMAQFHVAPDPVPRKAVWLPSTKPLPSPQFTVMRCTLTARPLEPQLFPLSVIVKRSLAEVSAPPPIADWMAA